LEENSAAAESEGGQAFSQGSQVQPLLNEAVFW
jgi:hypothetical protein